MELLEGMRVLIASSGAFVDGEVVSVSDDEISLYAEDLEPQIASYRKVMKGIDWKYQTEMVFPRIGQVKRGNVIRLGRGSGKSVFVPGQTTLFVDGFKNTENGCVIIGKNLNMNICIDLRPADYKRKWIIEK